MDFVISPPSPHVFVTTDEDLLVRFGAMEPVDASLFLHHIKVREALNECGRIGSNRRAEPPD